MDSKLTQVSTINTGQAIVAQRQNSLKNISEKLSNQNDSEKIKKEIDKASAGFEALLLHQMMESMWNTVEFSGMLDEKSNEAQIYRDMLNQAIADSTAEGRGIGVKQMMQRELLKTVKASK